MKFQRADSNTEYFIFFQNGEERGFDHFFRMYYKALCFFASSFLNDPDDSKDVVQDCFMELWAKRAAIREPEAIQSYLYTTVKNACINHLRKEKKINASRKEILHLSEVADDTWLDKVVYAETMREIYAMIETLPPRMQQVFRMYYIDGKDHNEIAQQLHTSPETVRKQRYRALSLLREKFS